jgi:N-acetylglucosaminyldiphosphoundecaprenol N-acetyl-beta-D-mannosaminyltransferase
MTTKVSPRSLTKEKKISLKREETHDTVDIMGFPVYANHLDDIHFKDEKIVINTLNAYSFVLAKKDEDFRDALKNSDILVSDGFSIVLASRILNHTKIRKIAGADIFDFFCNRLNRTGGKCIFLGSTENTLQKMIERLTYEYPNIEAYTYSPPFKPEFTRTDDKKMIDFINAINPDVLFVGMTAPKQEKWVYRNIDKIDTKIVCSIGAVFDFYALTNKRPGKFWIKLNLEWFIRLIKEPRRLWKRYLIYSPIFFFDLLFCKRIFMKMR